MISRVLPPLSAALAGAAVGLHVAALLRVHALLAGSGPSTGLAVTGAILAGWAWGASAGKPSRAAGMAAALLVAATGFLAPVPLGLISGYPAALLTALLAALPVFLLARARPGAPSPALLLGMGLGLLASALFTLPLLGPTTTAVLAAALLVAASVLGARPATDSADSTASTETGSTDSTGSTGSTMSRSEAPARGHELSPPVEPLAAWVASTGVLFALASSLRPWPFALAAAGFTLLGVALGAGLRLEPRRRLALALAGSLFLVPWFAGWLHLDAAALVEGPTRPLVAPLWGALAILLAAAGNAFGGGLVAGLVVPRPRGGALAVAGATLLLLALSPSLPWTPGSLAALGFAGLLAASLTPTAGRLFDRIGGRLAGASLVALCLAAVLLLPGLMSSEVGPWSRAGRHVVLGFDFAGAAPRMSLELNGHGLVKSGPEHRPDEVWAGHLAGLLVPVRGSALLVGTLSGEALKALELQGFEEIHLLETSRELAEAAVHVAGLPSPPPVAPAPSAWPRRAGGWDAIVVQADDPSIPELAPLFTPSAWRQVASLLAPGGVVVQRLRVGRLGPEGLLGVVRLVQTALPETWLTTADLARDGSVLLIARAGRGGPPGGPPGGSPGGSPGGPGGSPGGPPEGPPKLPWNELVLDPLRNGRLTEAAAVHLRSVLLLKQDDLLGTFAAGGRELAAIEPGVPAFDPWAPGFSALALPAPEGLATQLSRALLYGRIQTVELAVALRPEDVSPPWDAWPFVGLETNLSSEWSAEGGALRFANRFRPVMGDFGLYRDLSRKIVFTRPERRIEVVELERSVEGPDTVNASARSLLDEHAKRTVEALVHGHRALGVIREPGGRVQHVHLTWYCPVQGRLYLADYRLDDARPGLFEEPLEELGKGLRCAHERPRPPTPNRP